MTLVLLSDVMSEELLPVTKRPTSENKTGSWRTSTPEITDKCTGCGICASFCPDGCIAMVAASGKFPRKAQIDYDFCKGCLICAAECPVKAIIIKSKEKEK